MRTTASSARFSLTGGTLVAVVATVGSLYFSEVMGLIPCELCWYQDLVSGIPAGLLREDI
jgi:disulfide bond formation protein DsbB